jgi:hypothetical protein
MSSKIYNIKISTKSDTNLEQYRDFDEWYDCESQKLEQERLLQRDIDYQRSIINSNFKKVLKEGAPFTGDLRETFPEHYTKCFVPIKKKPNNDFVYFKYYTDDGKGDDEESEDSPSDYEENQDGECKDLLLKEIELMFQNGYTYKDIEKLFPTFYKINVERINFLYQQVYAERFKRDPTLTIEKDIDIYKSRQDQIEIIEKRRTLKKLINKLERNKEEEEEEDSDTHSYKRYKAKEDFNSVLNKESQKAQQQKPIKR